MRKQKEEKMQYTSAVGSYLSSILYYMCVLFCKNLFIIWKLCFFYLQMMTFCKKLNPKCVFLFQRPSKQPKVDMWYDNMPLVRNQLGS